MIIAPLLFREANQSESNDEKFRDDSFLGLFGVLITLVGVGGPYI